MLPLVKPHHWTSITLEVRANYEDYEGSIQSFPVELPGMPQEMIYARESRLVKEQRSRLGMQLMLPRIPREKELTVELLQPGAIRADELWQVPVRLLPPGQMLIVFLSKESSTQYAGWTRLPCMVPSSAEARRRPGHGIPARLPDGAAGGRGQAVPLAASADLGSRSATSSGTGCRPIPCRSRISRRCSTGCTGAASSC